VGDCMKMQDWRLENVALENERTENDGLDNDGLENDGRNLLMLRVSVYYRNLTQY